MAAHIVELYPIAFEGSVTILQQITSFDGAGTLHSLGAIPENKAKEWISLAYIDAIVAQVGLNIRMTKWDDGVDLDIGSTKPVLPNFDLRNLWVTFQVKATENWEVRDGHIPYFLKRSNYEQLCAPSLTPQYLILYTLPRGKCRCAWVKQDPESASLQSRAFFLNLADAKPIKDTSRGKKRIGKTVYLPTANRLTAWSLRQLYVNAMLAVKEQGNA